MAISVSSTDTVKVKVEVEGNTKVVFKITLEDRNSNVVKTIHDSNVAGHVEQITVIDITRDLSDLGEYWLRVRFTNFLKKDKTSRYVESVKLLVNGEVKASRVHPGNNGRYAPIFAAPMIVLKRI